MSAAEPLQPEDLAGEEDEAEEPPTRTSFFADGAGADELVCASIWRIFMRDSIDRGFETRRGEWGTLSPALAAIEPKTERRSADVMTEQPNDLTEREQALLAAYRAHEEKHGTPPSRVALGRAAGMKAANDPSMQAMVYSATKRLVALGLIPKGRSGGAPGKTSPPPKERSPRRQPKAVPAPAKSGALPIVGSTSSALDVLRAELAIVERRAGALRDAIAILESPDYGGAVAS